MGMKILSERNVFSLQSRNLLPCHSSSLSGWFNNIVGNQWVLTKMLWKNSTGLQWSLKPWIVIWTIHLLMLVTHDAYMYKWCNGNVTQPVGHVGASENHTKRGLMMGVMFVYQEIRGNQNSNLDLIWAMWFTCPPSHPPVNDLIMQIAWRLRHIENFVVLTCCVKWYQDTLTSNLISHDWMISHRRYVWCIEPQCLINVGVPVSVVFAKFTQMRGSNQDNVSVIFVKSTQMRGSNQVTEINSISDLAKQNIFQITCISPCLSNQLEIPQEFVEWASCREIDPSFRDRIFHKDQILLWETAHSRNV